MDLTQLLTWIVGANTVINFAATVYTLMSARATKALKAIDELGVKVTALKEDRQRAGDVVVVRFHEIENRLLKIERDMVHLPDREHAQRMELALEKLSGRIDTLAKGIEPIEAISERWQEMILEQAKK